MRRLAFVLAAPGLLLACGPGSTPEGSGGAGSGTGGTESGTGGGLATGGSGAGAGGATQSGGAAQSGGSGGATGGEQGSTGGSAPIEPGEALDQYLQAGQPKVAYLQQILGELADLDAMFDPQMRPEADSCDWTIVGACAMSAGCTTSTAAALDAGTMTLSHGTETVVSDRLDGDYESPGTFFDPLLVGGEPLVFSAAGGADLPAFELEVEFPLVIIIDSPAGDLMAPIAVPTTADLTLEFRRASGNVALLLTGGFWTGDMWQEILCVGTGDPGTLVVPQEALAYLGPGIEIELYTAALGSVEVGDQKVNVEVLAGTSNDERERLYKLVTQ